MKKITQFLKEVRQELSKVSWPSKNQTLFYTFVVVISALILAIFLGFLDFLFEWSINYFILN
jgi:preprotein translocase subunit SecE